MTIRILSETIASQIAAGEVVERPASAVKELIENAIDAGATEISVETREAGKRLILVTDNGAGIPAEELPLAVARHATSKLQTAEDLFEIHTLGFRGEALASIGSVSRLTLTSKPEEQLAGYRIRMDGGAVVEKGSVPAPTGSQVRVEDLFFNVPARMKFLKSDSTENRQITGLLTRYALAYPHIRWSLTMDQRQIFRTTGSGNQMEILQELFGAQDSKHLLPITFAENTIRIHGYISSLSLNRSNRKDITFFVNGRWVQDAALTAAVIKAYNTMLMVGRYPVAVLFIELPARQVDVNVHPSKAEVRFRDADQVFSALQRAIRRGLLAYSPLPEIQAVNLWGRQAGSEPERADFTPAAGKAWEEADAASETTRPQSYLPMEPLPLLRLIGQVAATYLVAEGPDGLYLIDQHAAHERVLFDQLMAQYRAAAVPVQALVQPAAVEFPAEKAHTLAAQLPVLRELGFEVEEFGPNAFLVRAVPAVFAAGDPKAVLQALVEDFEEDEEPLAAEIEARIAGRVCKRLAVKAGKILSESEQKALLLNLEASQSPRTCPHGRPTMIHLSAALLERQFGRTGAI
ncbi:MAG: DNA mismatch repair endonuclease MutL [Chloroflexi bacterium]|jgi:DNA mismatch repair protein MutL|nr:DNA mismatch repair endonuclease MutL [Anaerolineaceae bacterium]NLI44150.1 DNA mismatch repair endonuclease MutL [Chloroflexota bacterium]HOT24866.1 DNA mismatch repair endonuclease MutL [Anaerolineaceae bacterium]HQH57635.1 DNA mismatch repair endonuclease MutL [Anaerolineaceae bacterium]HQK03193.1 DNA mismatch repair endonuclease MutL [Anaerolineaceae bacterium]